MLDWNKHALDALANPPSAGMPGAGMPTPVQAVHLAIVQGAVYDAVNAIDGGREPYLEGLPSVPGSASESAATATAARDVLVAVLNQAPLTATFTAAVRVAIIERLIRSLRARLRQPPPSTVHPRSRTASTRVKRRPPR